MRAIISHKKIQSQRCRAFTALSLPEIQHYANKLSRVKLKAVIIIIMTDSCIEYLLTLSGFILVFKMVGPFGAFNAITLRHDEKPGAL